MQPTIVERPPPVQPTGNWLRRAWVAVVCQGRLPTRLAGWLDRLCIACGRRTRTIRTSIGRMRVRRQAADEHYVREVIGDRAYHPPGFEITATDMVIDVGGNIGAFAVSAGCDAQRGRVITVEPIEGNFRLLCENVRRNHLEHVLPVQAAVVGSNAQSIEVFLSPAGSGNHSTQAELAGATGQAEQVTAVRLADLFERFELDRCDYLKIDCEGAEYEILEGLPPRLAAKIHRIAIEYHVTADTNKHEQAERLIQNLERLGYRVEIYTDVVGTNHGMLFARRGHGP